MRGLFSILTAGLLLAGCSLEGPEDIPIHFEGRVVSAIDGQPVQASIVLNVAGEACCIGYGGGRTGDDGWFRVVRTIPSGHHVQTISVEPEDTMVIPDGEGIRVYKYLSCYTSGGLGGEPSETETDDARHLEVVPLAVLSVHWERAEYSGGIIRVRRDRFSDSYPFLRCAPEFDRVRQIPLFERDGDLFVIPAGVPLEVEWGPRNGEVAWRRTVSLDAFEFRRIEIGDESGRESIATLAPGTL